jgi:hypothetical protein
MLETEASTPDERKKTSFDWLAVWILLSAWASVSGWLLSAFKFLTPFGTILSWTFFLVLLFLLRPYLRDAHRLSVNRLVRSRYLVPKLWALLALLALIGGIAYPPDNYDYLTYRFTRVLYWDSNHAWRWVPTVNERINFSGTGFEWLMAPLFVVFKTDRLFFLINFIPYLLLPGIIFSVFSRLGISKRISWWWMWVLPCGYCYILQSASVGNDSFATLYLLASLYYLLRLTDSTTTKNLALSCLAIALMTGVKASTLPLVLPWMILVFFQRRYLLEKCRPIMLAIVLVIGVVVSFLPTALLNIHYTGDYSGDPGNTTKYKLSNPVSGVVGNALQMAKDNLFPPIWVHPIDWEPALPTWLSAKLLADFPRLDLHSSELQIEEEAGIGLGIILFTGTFMTLGLWTRTTANSLVVPRNGKGLLIAIAGVIALLAYMAKLGIPPASRLVAAFYPLVIAAILMIVSLEGRIVHRKALRWVGYLAMASAFPLVILCPARPLFPVQVVSDLMRKNHVSPTVVTRFDQVYNVYATRFNAFKNLIVSIPPEERIVGFLQMGDDPEAAFWRPFGSRKICEVTPTDSAKEVEAKGVNYVLISDDALTLVYHTTLSRLAANWSASIVAEKDIVLKAHRGPETWYVLRL